MNFLPPGKNENSPYTQLFMLAGYTAAGMILCMITGYAVVYLMYGKEAFLSGALLSGDKKYLDGLKIFQILTSVFFFLLPPLFLALTEGKRADRFFGLKTPKLNLLVLVIAIMICSMPFSEWTALANQKMVLPDFLKSVQQWMKDKEDEAAKMTLVLLKMDHTGEFLVNLLMIAVLPAIGEELMFRGGIQRAFSRMFKNHHAAIWTAAFIFSAIHMQFFGFLPRLLLGAGFGYLYYWSGNLGYSIFAHFLNNGYAVCTAWYLQRNNLPLNEAEDTFHFKWYGYALSLILTIILFIYFKNKTVYGKQLD